MGLIGRRLNRSRSLQSPRSQSLPMTLDYLERNLERQVANDTSVPQTDRQAIIRARRGQGLFKDRVNQIESTCRKDQTWIVGAVL